ncbi:MAG TPA: T9SS type A sorting domain-containing protein [Bacteroidia bacterium]|nr:T9SS type A sorting domain-containing protein [Bacteroidia bacterium]
MKRYLFLVFLFIHQFSFAQLQINWIDNFCCFDSIAPHTFSTPMGIVQKGDSVIVGFWEDNYFNIDVLNSVNGQHLSDHIYTNDTLNTPYFFGGSFIESNGVYACLGTYSDNFGNSKIVLKGFNDQFQEIWRNSILVSDVHTQPSKLLRDPSTGDIYFTQLSDSLCLYRFSVNGVEQWRSCTDDSSFVSVAEEQFICSDSSLVYVTDNSISPDIRLPHFRKLNKGSGNFLQQFTFPDLVGKNHVYLQKQDELICAFLDSGTSEIKFKRLDLINGNSSPVSGSGVITFERLKNLALSPNQQHYYIQSTEHLVKTDTFFQLIYSRSLTPARYPAENKSPLLFDANENLLLNFSYINNMIPNEDIMVLRIDANTGVTLDSLLYNDSRNTADHAMFQYLDSNGNLNLVFANDYDNFAILQEETQLGIFQISGAFLNTIQLESGAGGIVISPNPCTESITIETNISAAGNYRVIDLSGRVVMDGKLGNPKLQVSGLNSGCYFLQIQYNSGKTESAYFIKN